MPYHATCHIPCSAYLTLWYIVCDTVLILGPEERQREQHHQTLEDVVFNVFEDVIDSSTNHLSGFYLKLNKKLGSGTYI
jgi:hypothetical protein